MKKIIFILIPTLLGLFSASANSTYKVMPTMDQSLKNWIMGGVPYYGDCANEGLTETTVKTLNESQPVYNYDSSGWCLLNSVYLDNKNLDKLPNEFQALLNIKSFDLQNNNFIDLEFLRKHSEFENVYLNGNENLFDLSPLSNVVSGTFYFDNYKKYKLLGKETQFCQNYINGNVTIENNYSYNICEGMSSEMAWLEFISQCSGRDFTSLGELKDSTATLSCNSKNIYNLPPLNKELDYFKGYLNLSNNKISDISSLSSLNSIYSLSLNSNNIEDISPLGDLNFESLYISRNGLSDISFLSGITEVSSLDISYNPINDLSPLSQLSTINGTFNVVGTEIKDFSALSSLERINSTLNAESISSLESLNGLENLSNLKYLYVEGSENLKDISALKNINIDGFYLSSNQLNSFVVKVPSEGVFCEELKARNGSLNIYVDNYSRNDLDFVLCEENAEEQAYNAAAWIKFFNDSETCGSVQYGPLTNLNELKTRNARVWCNGKALVDSDLPQSGLITSSLELRLYSNELQTLSGLKDVQTIRTLMLNDNLNITSLSNLSNLEVVAGTLDLSGTSITDFTDLSSISRIDSLKVENISTLTSFAGLEAIGRIPSIHISGSNNLTDIRALENVDVVYISMTSSQLEQFTQKASTDSLFCNNLRNNGAYLLVDGVTEHDKDFYLCEENAEEQAYNAAAWINFFNDSATCRRLDYGPLTNLNELKTRNARVWCDGKALVDSDLPQSGLITSSLELRLYSNELQTLSGLKDVQTIRTLMLNDNLNITSLSNLSNLEVVAGTLDLSGTSITDFTDLSSISRIDSLKVENISTLTSFAGLEAIGRIPSIHISGSNNLTDIRALENVDVVYISMTSSQLEQFTQKASTDSLFCNNLRNNGAYLLVDGVTEHDKDFYLCE